MKVRLLRNAKIWHKVGEIVEVSPEECQFLVSTDGAVVVEAVKDQEAQEKAETKMETPEKKRKKK